MNNFFTAYDALRQKSGTGLLLRGIELAKEMQRAVVGKGRKV